MLRSLLVLGLTSLVLLLFSACSCPKSNQPTVYRGGANYEDAVHQ